MVDEQKKKVDAVFEGGGVKGIGLVGAVAVTEENGYQFENVAGTSARKLVIILLSIVLSVMHVLSYAEKSITEEEIFNDLRGKSLAESLSKSDSLLLLLKEEEDRRNAWGLNVEGNFIGDEADDKTTADLYITADITKGEYPRQFRFTVESKIGLEDYKLEDDVTALLLNYDYYIHPFVEVYSFIERFSDSYMDIKQRFEIGFGIKLEGTFLGLVDDKDTKLIERLPWPDTLTNEQKDTLEHYRLEHYRKTALTSIKKRDARLRAGIAFSFFEELEQAEIVKMDTTLPSEERFRFVIRPSVRLRITKNLQVGGYCYWKLPAFRPRKKNGHLDYRTDAQFWARLKLSEDRYGNERVGLNVRYDFRFDNAPPSAELNGERFTARKFHWTATLGISVRI